MIFEVKDGSFSYSFGKNVFQNVNFSVREPEILAVLGPNGAGKTTLMRCMLGLLPWKKGCSSLDGVDLRQIPLKEMWRKIGYVPQAKMSSFVYTAEEMVVLGRSSHLGFLEQPGKKDWEIVDECLDMTGISHLKGKLCSRLSGGEYQMVLIARALAGQPSLLVLDEPESNLDFKNQQIVLETVRRLCGERGIAAIINTHFPEHAMELADKALLLRRGGDAAFGATREILTEKNMTQAFDVQVHVETIQIAGMAHTCVVPVLGRG